MKQFVLFLSLLFIGAALADSAPTSVGYVDSRIGELQNKISAVDTNTVLTTTNTAGEIGQKSIYDATGNYVEQQNALVTAEVANAAIQNAIDTEFVCTEWLDGAERTNENCLIYTVRNPAPNRVLPTGYTALEYLESYGTEWIDTGIKANSSIIVDIRVWHPSYYLPTTDSPQAAIGTREGTNTYGANVFQFGFISENHFFNRYGFGYISGDIFTPEVWYDVHLENKNCVVNGDASYFNAYEFSPTMNTQGTLYLFATHDIAQSSPTFLLKGRIGYCKIQKDEALVRNFVPARRDSDGVLGMYDLVSNALFTSAGSGMFIAGPELNVWLTSGN